MFLLHMGDSREVPHVNIVRKLRHNCEDVNFASSIYSNTLKQFSFIVDYCLSLHIMYKHSQTRSEHFLYKPITNDVHSKFTQVRNRHLFYEDTYDLLKRNIGDISRDLNNCWIVEENSFPSMYHKGFNMSRFFCNRLFDDVIYAQSNRMQDAVFKRYVLHSMKTRTLGTCLPLDSISVTIKRMTNNIYFLCWDLLVQNTFIDKSE